MSDLLSAIYNVFFPFYSFHGRVFSLFEMKMTNFIINQTTKTNKVEKVETYSSLNIMINRTVYLSMQAKENLCKMLPPILNERVSERMVDEFGMKILKYFETCIDNDELSFEYSNHYSCKIERTKEFALY